MSNDIYSIITGRIITLLERNGSLATALANAH